MRFGLLVANQEYNVFSTSGFPDVSREAILREQWFWGRKPTSGFSDVSREAILAERSFWVIMLV